MTMAEKRKYVIEVQCEDAAGNESPQSVIVTVPNSQAVGREMVHGLKVLPVSGIGSLRKHGVTAFRVSED